MYYLVYETKNLINGKIYVGTHKTSNLGDGYIGSGKLLKRAIKKYGRNSFETTILASCATEEEMFEKEKEIVTKEFLEREDTYNLICGGNGGFSYINKKGLNNSSDNYLKATNRASKLMKEDKQYRNLHSARSSETMKRTHKEGKLRYDTFTGKSHSKEARIKISKARKGKYTGKENSQHGTCWIYNENLKKNKKIKKEDFPLWERQGWKRGVKMSYHSGQKHK